MRALSVTVGLASESSSLAIYIVVGSVVLAVFLSIIVLMLLCSCYFRHKKIDFRRALEV